MSKANRDKTAAERVEDRSHSVPPVQSSVPGSDANTKQAQRFIKRAAPLTGVLLAAFLIIAAGRAWLGWAMPWE